MVSVTVLVAHLPNQKAVGAASFQAQLRTARHSTARCDQSRGLAIAQHSLAPLRFLRLSIWILLIFFLL